jgi:hypothetical protein
MDNQTLYGVARQFVAVEFEMDDTSRFPDSKIRLIVEKLWDGGWQGFAEFNGFKVSPARDTHIPQTDTARLAMISGLTRRTFRIGLLDEIVTFSIKKESMILVTKCHEIQEWRSRIRVLKQGIRRYAWEKVNDQWVMIEDFPNEKWDDDVHPYEVVGQYGQVMTPERYEEHVDQVETCYRPGTSRSPMDGYAALYPSIATGEE